MPLSSKTIKLLKFLSDRSEAIWNRRRINLKLFRVHRNAVKTGWFLVQRHLNTCRVASLNNALLGKRSFLWGHSVQRVGKWAVIFVIRQPGKPYECMTDRGEPPTVRGSFDSRRRIGGKENLGFHASFSQYFLEKVLCPSQRFWREFAQYHQRFFANPDRSLRHAVRWRGI